MTSVPLRRAGEVEGVLTLERPADAAPGLEDVEGLRLISDLVLPRLREQRRHDRWAGARAAMVLREWLQVLVGPKHTWAKMLAIALLGLILFLTLATGEDHIDASFTITSIEHRVVAAPFDGRLEEIAVEPGDMVTAGETLLATLDRTDLRLEIAAAEAERAVYLREADLALRDAKAVEVKIAQANLRRVEARLRLLEKRVEDATFIAPITGTVVSSDLSRRIGAPVETGEVLFEIAAVGLLRAELEVPEDRIADLVLRENGAPSRQRGKLASVSYPGNYIVFEVEHINPVAEVIDQKNVFRVQVELLGTRPWLRPGMRGIAKLDAGRKCYAALWSRRLVDWLRMRLWI